MDVDVSVKQGRVVRGVGRYSVDGGRCGNRRRVCDCNQETGQVSSVFSMDAPIAGRGVVRCMQAARSNGTDLEGVQSSVDDGSADVARTGGWREDGEDGERMEWGWRRVGIAGRLRRAGGDEQVETGRWRRVDQDQSTSANDK